MLQVQTAFSTEIDDLDALVEDILSQLDLSALLKNSAGILTCHSDFIDIGLLEALHERLPFDFIGMTTAASATIQGYDRYSMALTVLTSDDVTFVATTTKPLDKDHYIESIRSTYSEAHRDLPGNPALVIAFFPYLKYLSGADLNRALDVVCDGVPFWGPMATGIQLSHDQCRTIHNNSIDNASLAMLLVHGPIDPEFAVVSIPEYNTRDIRGTITEADGCTLRKINNMPAKDYLHNLGITLLADQVTTLPLMVYYPGTSEPVTLGIFNINEDGSFLCGGEMIVGSGVAVGTITPKGILDSAEELIRQIRQTGRRSGTLIMPCVTRYVILAPDQNAEMCSISDKLGKESGVTFALCYAGGEFCPIKDDTGHLRNTFHNYTIIACIF